jgi:hypothetical protein
VKLQDKTVLKGMDVVVRTGGAGRALVEEFERIPVSGKLLLEIQPTQADAAAENQPVLNGIEVLRTNASEVKGGVAGR